MKSYAFLFWGDVIVWAGMAVYVLVLLRKMASVERRLASIEAQRGGGPSAT